MQTKKSEVPVTHKPAEARTDDDEPPDPGRVKARTPPRRQSLTQISFNPAGTTLQLLELPRSPSAPARVPAVRCRVRARSLLPVELAEVEVVVLYTRATSSKRWEAHELLADQENAQVAKLVADSLRPHARKVQVRSCRRDVAACLRDLDPARHLIFNLYEGQVGRTGDEVAAARQLEADGFIYTGAPYAALARTCNKWTTKKILAAAGLPTPAYHIIREARDWQGQLPAPVIVKPIAEEGSIGITQSSLARADEDVLPLIESSLAKYRQAVIVEEFVAGREINAALWGNGKPKLLPLAEIAFTWTDDPLQQFVTYASKWVEESPEFTGTPGICPADLNESDQAAIEKASLKAWHELHLSGYARIDIRLRDGIPYILEVNGNPDLAPDAGFFRSVRTSGMAFDEMTSHIAQLALLSRA
jgi:D-alanine-D-alanine ligase